MITGMIVGLFVGDSCGVPHEFSERQALAQNPVTDMDEYGTHNQPMGTWSDDSSMTWCLAETIIEGYSAEKLTNKFLDFYQYGTYTVDGLFDIGISTRRALQKVLQHKKAGSYQPQVPYGGSSVHDNGNGSLMRISPLIVLLKPLDKVHRYQLVKEVSSITHAHVRSVLACYWFCEYLLHLEETGDKLKAYAAANASFMELYELPQFELPEAELDVFGRILSGKVHHLHEREIRSSGYVIHTLECCLHTFLRIDDYRSGVLKGINYGEDTDTVAAILGCLYGYHLGFDSIPNDWVQRIKRIDEVIKLAEQLEQYYATALNKSNMVR